MTKEVQQPKKYRLPKRFAKKWLGVLRSGKYKQTTDALVKVNDDGTYCYCVLGVAGKLADCIMRPNIDTSLATLPEGVTDDSLHTNVKNLSNVPKELHGCKFDSLPSRLMDLNDSGKYTFPQIADWIQENVELYE